MKREPEPLPPNRNTRDRAMALWVWLLALVVIRAALVPATGTWVWSLQGLRFTAPALGSVLMALAALALLPPVARWQAPAFERIGAASERGMGMAIVLAIAAMACVAALPDRTWYVGDFLLRAGALESGRDIATISPQSLPLDRLLHIDLPRRLAGWGWAADAPQAARWLGAVEAGGLAVAALALARELSAGSGAALPVTLVLLGGSTLALFTGYAKCPGDLCLLTLLFACFGIRLLRAGRSAVGFSAALMLALATHRSSLILAPAWATTLWVAWRTRRIRARDPRFLAATLAPLALLAVWAPRFARVLLGFDLTRHLGGPEVRGAGGPLAAALAPLHLLDMLNVVLAYAPLAPVAALLLARLVRDRRPPSHDVVAPAAVLAFAIPALAMLLLVHPQQGLFRDWDVFAIPGTVFAILSAAALASSAPQALTPGLSVALAFGAVLSAGLWLGPAADTDRGLAQAHAFAKGPPARSPSERGKTWEFLGDRNAALGRWDDAALSLDQAIVDQPTPRLFRMLGVAEAQRGRYEASEAAIFEAARRDPGDTTTWAVLVSTAMKRRDSAMVRLAAGELLRRSPNSPLAREALGLP